MKKTIVFFAIIFTSMGCTSIIDGLAETNIKGDWNLITITDVNTGKITDISTVSVTTRMLGNHQGNAISFDGENFNLYNQINGPSGDFDGTYNVELTTLTLNFFDKTNIVRSINSAGETELILADTIAGAPKLLTFTK